MSKFQPNREVDIALHVVCQNTKPGVCLTLQELADVCSCGRSLISSIELRAKKKIRNHKDAHLILEYLKD